MQRIALRLGSRVERGDFHFHDAKTSTCLPQHFVCPAFESSHTCDSTQRSLAVLPSFFSILMAPKRTYNRFNMSIAQPTELDPSDPDNIYEISKRRKPSPPSPVTAM